MNALVYRRISNRSLEEKPKPVIELATDAIVKITKTTVCGTDLHIVKDDISSMTGPHFGMRAGWSHRKNWRERFRLP